MSEPDPTAARLAALRATPVKPKMRRVLIPALSGLAGLIAGGYFGYLVYVASQAQPAPPDELGTSTPQAFRTGSIGPQDFASLDTASDRLDPKPEDLAPLVAELRARILDLTKNPITVVKTDRTAIDALGALQQKMTALQAASIKQDAAFKQLRIERQSLAATVKQLESALTERAPSNIKDRSAADLARARAEQELRLREELKRQASRKVAQSRAQAEAQLQAQINSPMVALRRPGNSTTTAVEENQRYSGEDAFLRQGAPAVSAAQASIIANPSHTILQGTRIDAVLENAVSSALAGYLVAIVSYDVYSMDMSRVLIPRGSKLFGRYSANVALGQKRLLVAWDRLVTTDQQSVALNAYGGDRLGRSGMPGKVNTHFATRFGSAALISVIGLTPALLAHRASNDVAAQALEQVGQDFAGSLGNVMAEYLQMKPTITLDQGANVTVIVNGDLELY